MLEALTAAHPDWLAQRICVPDFARRYGKAAARAAETTIPFQAGYARRAGIEGTMHQAASHGARRARYRGLPRTRLDHIYMACALNLLRLEAFWTGTPLDRQRTSHLAHSNSASPHDGELTTRILDVIKTASQQELG